MSTRSLTSQVRLMTPPYGSSSILRQSASSSSVLPSWPAEVGPSPHADRPAVWPPSPTRRPDSAVPVYPAANTRAIVPRGYETGRVAPKQRAMHSGGPHHGGLGVDVQQEYEGHAVQAPAPFDRGFVKQKDEADIGFDVEEEVSSSCLHVRLDFRKRCIELLSPIMFQSNSSELFVDPTIAEAITAEVGLALQTLNDRMVQQRLQPFGLAIEGHTSGVHSSDMSELSRSRAQKVEKSVRALLQSRGPDEENGAWGVAYDDLLVFRGYGSLRPTPGTSNGDTENPVAANRRVEMRLVELSPAVATRLARTHSQRTRAKLAAKSQAVRKVHAHVRGKVMPIAVGEGKQTVYWLGVSAVQRYLRLPDSYTSPFSQELTALRVLALVPPLELPSFGKAEEGDHTPRAGTAAGGSRDRTPGGSRRPPSKFAQQKAEEEEKRKAEAQRARAAAEAAAEAQRDAERMWSWLDNGARLCECGLSDEAHVWIDVGDGGPPGVVAVGKASMLSRPFSAKPAGLVRDERRGEPEVRIERLSLQTAPDPMAITGEQCLLGPNEQEPDKKATVQYRQVSHPTVNALGEYHRWVAAKHRAAAAAAEAAGADGDDADGKGYEEFKKAFGEAHLTDLPGAKEWMSEVKAILYSKSDLLTFIFSGVSEKPGTREGTMPLLEFWELARTCALLTPYYGINELDHILPDHNRTRRHSVQALHEPEARITFPEFLEALVRSATHMQADPTNPAKPVPDALKDLLDEHIVPMYESAVPAHCLGEYGLEPLEPLHPSVRRMLRMHTYALTALFARTARRTTPSPTLSDPLRPSPTLSGLF